MSDEFTYPIEEIENFFMGDTFTISDKPIASAGYTGCWGCFFSSDNKNYGIHLIGANDGSSILLKVNEILKNKKLIKHIYFITSAFDLNEYKPNIFEYLEDKNIKYTIKFYPYDFYTKVDLPNNKSILVGINDNHLFSYYVDDKKLNKYVYDFY